MQQARCNIELRRVRGALDVIIAVEIEDLDRVVAERCQARERAQPVEIDAPACAGRRLQRLGCRFDAVADGHGQPPTSPASKEQRRAPPT